MLGVRGGAAHGLRVAAATGCKLGGLPWLPLGPSGTIRGVRGSRDTRCGRTGTLPGAGLLALEAWTQPVRPWVPWTDEESEL